MDAEPLVDILDNEIFSLRTVFCTYERLYRKDAETRKLLSECDAGFFNDLYIIYLHYISIGVARLLDPEKTGTKSNLTIFTLISILKEKGFAEADSLKNRLKEMKAKAYNFTDPRNQLVSHLDFEANYLVSGKKAIPSFICSEFEDFYKDIGILMNDIRSILGMSPNMYEWGITGHGCGGKLIHSLQVASNSIKRK